MTAETPLAPIELIALERGRREGQQEGLASGALIGRVQACQEFLGLAATPTEELAGERQGALEVKLRALEAQLRSRLREHS